MNLPLDIVVEILSRLPPIDAIICKLVCKKWLNVLSTPQFAQLHLSRSNPCLFAVQYVVSTPEIFCGILKFDDKNDPHNDPVFEFDLRKIYEDFFWHARMINSINGLVCFHFAGGQEILYVCNPVTRESVTVPTARRVGEYEDTVVCGFGVSIASGKYKVVRISQTSTRHDTLIDLMVGIKKSRCCVYTLGTGSWRSIRGVPSMYHYGGNFHISGVFFNGNLHWLIKDLEGSELISCFDLEKELFWPFPPPFPSKQPPRDVLFSFSLSVIRGCLCLCDNTSESDIIIWVMKEYGVKKSWTKDFVINKICCFQPLLSAEKVFVLEIFKDGDILFYQYRKNSLFTYNNESRTLQRYNKVLNLYLGPVLHVSSFVSLKAFEPEKVKMFPHLRHSNKLYKTNAAFSSKF